MNIKITHQWLLEYLDTKASPEEIQNYLSLCGPSIERVEQLANGDFVYDIEITSNRIDTASVIGIAREAAAILTRFGIPSKAQIPVFNDESVKPSHVLPLTITDDEKCCRRLLAVIMDNVEIKQSKQFIKERLEAAGIRSLNNVVDITNYVMLEMGHPTHVFDYDRINTNKFIIRHARNGEKIVTLDEKEYLLSSKDIIIDDGTGRIIDLPGIMGTANSVVTPETKRIIFFIESNDPVAIRGSSMRYGIRTTAATINEKSPDFHLAKQTLLRGIELFKKHTGATVASEIHDRYTSKPSKVTINTSVSYINKKIGVVIDSKQIVDILEQLEFKVVQSNDDLKIEVPTFRVPDVSIGEDIVEEVARIYGYHNLPNNLSPSVYVKQPKEFEDLFVYQNKIKMFLKHLGLHEVLNYSMISKEMIQGVDMVVDNHLSLSNVMSEEIRYLRVSLLPSLIKNIKQNQGKQDELKLFELAKVYIPQTNELPDEKYHLGIVTTTNFYDIKGIIESLLQELHITSYVFKKNNNHLFIDGAQTQLQIDNNHVGVIGELKSSYGDKNNLTHKVILAELDFQTLIAHAKTIATYTPTHPYAVIKLDCTLKKSTYTSYEVFTTHSFTKSSLLRKIEVVSQYKQNITYRLYFSSKDRNITEEEAKNELKSILK